MDFTQTKLTVAELFTCTLTNGVIGRFTNHPRDISYGGNTWQGLGKSIARGPIKFHADLTVDTVTIGMGINGVTVGGTENYTIPEIIRKDFLRGAHVKIEAIDYVALTAPTYVFDGYTSGDISYNDAVLTLKIGSILDRLQNMFPKLLYTEQCNHRVFNKYCGLTKTSWQVTSALDVKMGVDSKGTNTLIATTGVVPTISRAKSGTYAAEFLSTASNRLYRADTDLSADFPLKNGTSNTTFSIVAWFYIDAFASWRFIVAKGDAAGDKRSCMFAVANSQLSFRIGFNNGVSSETLGYKTIQTGRFYHCGITFDNSTKAWKMRLWDDTAQAIIYDGSGTATNNINVEDGDFVIGSRSDGSYQMDGVIDQVAVTKDILSTAEIDQIRQGTYDFDNDADCVSLFEFDTVTPETGITLYAPIFAFSSYAEGYWKQGEIHMTAGNNNGISRTIYYHGDGFIKLLKPFPELLGYDAFWAVPGCDRTGKICDEKFDNYPNFLGFEYIPKPEDIYYA